MKTLMTQCGEAMAEASTGKLRSADLLAWYDRHQRDLPWRAKPSTTADPYHVWLSEIMLQQTQVQAVIPYFLGFLGRWPTIGALAQAPRADVLAAWAGLGYYARARRLHDCAREVAGNLGGHFPDTEEGLRALPGIGAYTAGAIAAIAFGRPAAAVDGNVERVMARIFQIEETMPAAKKAVRKVTLDLIPADRPGDFAQALMDLGATICSPRKPACGICPWRDDCRARIAGVAEELPKSAPKKKRPHRYGLVFWLEREDGAVLFRTRPDEGLLGGMLEVPTTAWRDTDWKLEEAMADAPVAGGWQLLPEVVRHGFTHFTIGLRVATLGYCGEEIEGAWHHPDTFPSLALPTMTRKVIQLARTARL